MRLAVGQARTADELGDGDSFKTIHRSSKVRVVNVESRSACRSVSSTLLKLDSWLSETFTNKPYLGVAATETEVRFAFTI